MISITFILVALVSFIGMIVGSFLVGKVKGSNAKEQEIEIKEKTKAINDTVEVNNHVEEHRNDSGDDLRNRLREFVRDRNR
jgi:Na+-transporting methylmalonyl-CoA/oxaloacetate decarboxylase gamma subunit